MLGPLAAAEGLPVLRRENACSEEEDPAAMALEKRPAGVGLPGHWVDSQCLSAASCTKELLQHEEQYILNPSLITAWLELSMTVHISGRFSL
jgi:hypothetical protein